jgi:hypothetical protein
MTGSWRGLAAVAMVLSIVVGSPSALAENQAQAQPADWTFQLTPHFPADAGGTINIQIVATSITDDATNMACQLRLQLPSGEEWRSWTPGLELSKSLKGASQTDDESYGHAEAGPYVARVVRVDGGREDVVAEQRGWVGSPDAPVLVVDGLAIDPPTPRVGEPATVSVSVTNKGQTVGSRRVPVWLFVDEVTYQDPEIGSVSFDSVEPGETASASFPWSPDRGLGDGARLEARSSSELRGFRSSPLEVLAADDGFRTEAGGD